MGTGSRLSDVILKLPDRSTCRVERRLVLRRSSNCAPVQEYICTLPTGEFVAWLGCDKYRLPNGVVGEAVAHKLSNKGKPEPTTP
jgi:hypothetical protein